MENDRPNRLALVLKNYPEIRQSYIIREISLLEKMGYFVRIFALGHSQIRQWEDDFLLGINAEASYKPQNLLKHPFRFLKSVRTVFSANPAGFFCGIGTFIRLLGCTHNRKELWRDLLVSLHFSGSYAIPEGITSIYSFSAGNCATTALFISKFLQIRYNFTANASDIFTRNKNELLLKLNSSCFVVVQSEYCRQYLRNLGEFATRIYLFHHGIDLDTFRFPGRINNSEPPYRILTVGGFQEKDGEDVVIRALYSLRCKGVDFTYTLIGDGPEKNRIIKLIRQLDLDDIVTMLDMVHQNDLVDYYYNADVLILNSRIASDGDRSDIPDVLIEAMACGVPVVAADSGAIRELVEHEETGMLVKPDSAAEIVRACQFLFDDEISREMIIMKSRLKVEGRFNMNRLIDDFVDICENNELEA